MKKVKFTRAEVLKAAKDAESAVAQALASLKHLGVAEFERIPDSKTAGIGNGGRFLPGRRGDFDVIAGGRYTIIEVKNSLIHENFKGLHIANTFRPAQLSAAHRWKLQGAQTVALFHGTGGWFYLPTWEIADFQIKGRKSIPVPGYPIPVGGLTATLHTLVQGRFI